MIQTTTLPTLSGTNLDWNSEKLFLLFAQQYAPELLEQNDSAFEGETEDQRKMRIAGYIQKTTLLMEKVETLMSEWSKKLHSKKKDFMNDLESSMEKELPDFS